MARRSRFASPVSRDDWLGSRSATARTRPWAFEEQLLRTSPDVSPPTDAETDDLLASVVAQVHELARGLAEMEEKLANAAHDRLPHPPAADLPHSTVRRVSLRRHVPDDDYWLAHCEGFEVECPRGAVGVVESVRFVSRLDRPDQLEVGIGRFRSRALMVPVEGVEEVDPEQRRIRLTFDPCPIRRERSSAFLLRARRRLVALTPSVFR